MPRARTVTTRSGTPDGGLHEDVPALYVPTARLVLEVLSPDDEIFTKLDFYRDRGVEELLVAELEAHVGWPSQA